MALKIHIKKPFQLKRIIIGMLLCFRRKVDFAIIGFPKCATTSIGRNIETVQGVFLPPYEIQIQDLIRRQIDAGHESELFGIRNPNLIYERHNLTALVGRNPGIRLILCLRKPTDWLFSFYQYRKMEIGNKNSWIWDRIRLNPNLKQISFNDIIFREKTLAGVNLKRGIFADHIQFLLNYVDPQQILILFLEEISHSPEAAYEKIFRFLNLNHIFLPASPVSANKNQNFYEPKTNYAKQLKYLDSYYEPKNKELKALLQKYWGITQSYW